MITRILLRSTLKNNVIVVIVRKINQIYFRPLNELRDLRKFSSFEDHDEVENDFEPVIKPLEIKINLSLNSDDLIVKKIKNSSSFDEVYKIMKDVKTKDQMCQTLMKLFELSKSSNQFSTNKLYDILSKFEDIFDELTIEEISYCYFCFGKLGANIRHSTMERMTDKITKYGQNLPLICLSQLTSTLGMDEGLYASCLAVETFPRITNCLDNCRDEITLQLLTVCMTNISRVITLAILENFKRKVNELLDNETLNHTTIACNLRIINFLNFPHWSYRNRELLQRILLEHEHNIKFFEARQLVTTNKAIQSQFESAKLVPKIVERAQELIKEQTPDAELLALAVHHTTPEQRSRIVEMLRNFLSSYQISSNQSSSSLQTVFKVLRLLKISDISLCDSYWTKVINEIYAMKESKLDHGISKYMRKYMFFNNNLGGTYRHLEFEKSVIEIIKPKAKKQTTSPTFFAKYASFIIAYGSGSNFPNFILEKMRSFHDQLTINDCLLISRGIQISQDTRFRWKKSSSIEKLVSDLNILMEKTAKRHLKLKNLHLAEINTIIRSQIMRKSPRDTKLFHEMMKFYSEKGKLNLNSRLIREIIVNLQKCNYKMDNVCEQLENYILENWEHVSGETVEKILTCFFTLSYFPEHVDVFERSSEIMIRDFQYMSGLSIIQGLLSLVFYKSCPQHLLALVFSNEFVKRIEQEIAMCYSKDFYPQRIMNLMMQLNRAVCLDCPEYNIKWFQQSFIEAQASKLPVVKSVTHNEVHLLLQRIVKKPGYISVDRVTHYGYRVDFELYIDQYNRFVAPIPDDYINKNFIPSVNRIAILLLHNKMFCENDIHRLKGSELLRMRHLEMLGYRVIHVKIHDFNILYSNMAAKLRYLRKLLQLSA